MKYQFVLLESQGFKFSTDIVFNDRHWTEPSDELKQMLDERTQHPPDAKSGNLKFYLLKNGVYKAHRDGIYAIPEPFFPLITLFKHIQKVK